MRISAMRPSSSWCSSAGAAISVSRPASARLSDLIGGFPLWILPTLIIKFFMADIAWRVIRPDKTKASPARLVVGFLLASAWMAAAYTLFGALLYDSLAAGLASAPGLIAEGVLNSAIAIVAAGILQKTPLGQR